MDIGHHVFPTIKYRLVHDELVSKRGFSEKVFVRPEPATDVDILLVHTREYVQKLRTGTLSPQEIITLELPYSKELVESSWLNAGGTILSTRIALEDMVGVHLGGGFHHAYPDHGEGFCVVNDIAVGIRRLQKDGKIKRAFVVDCDLHQGNGTAAIFTGDKSVFTFSIHQENNYPFFKPPSDVDIGLMDRVTDKEYLRHLKDNIPGIIEGFRPDLMFYVAGADPYEDDQLGNLALTAEGLKKRDEFVISAAKAMRIPICIVLAGGYAYQVEDTVQIHCNTIETAFA